MFLLLPCLKSVSYQPLPLNLNPDAEMSFFKVGLPQAGQSINGESLIF
jgi:hypothetical protein